MTNLQEVKTNWNEQNSCISITYSGQPYIYLFLFASIQRGDIYYAMCCRCECHCCSVSLSDGYVNKYEDVYFLTQICCPLFCVLNIINIFTFINTGVPYSLN